MKKPFLFCLSYSVDADKRAKEKRLALLLFPTAGHVRHSKGGIPTWELQPINASS